MTVAQKTPAVRSAGMSLREAILERRAVRSYTAQKVDDPTIHALLEAAVEAPSAMNLQPWNFVVIQQPALLKRISDEAKHVILADPRFHVALERGAVPLTDPAYDIFHGATTAIAIYAKPGGLNAVADCYLAAQNLMLAACDRGLATCPIGFAVTILQSDAMKKELSAPPEYIAAIVIAVGHPASVTPHPGRKPPHVLKWLH